MPCFFEARKCPISWMSRMNMRAREKDRARYQVPPILKPVQVVVTRVAANRTT